MSKTQKTENPERNTYETILKKLVKDGGVRGWIVVNYQGIPVKYYGYENEDAIKFAGGVMSLVDKCNKFFAQDFVHEIIPQNLTTLQTIQLRTQKNELIIVPHFKVLLICVYDPAYEEPQKENGEQNDEVLL
ncbi:hypothetical protein RFI_28774 [Reticulomyxa filosa]|uniref:Roadblock/LAMTOR2 domain-containing protein n=1 Tax=Reticulomyxa filosa TaxID=46433 RepID=X6M3V8_RETFI|nr:hypothetical protein RFI_28774 [Reticulomyxa filosa]|eukprot:ETO08614.1 hypothetical protein RFI_28774 [Reticulomyxa filosa]